MVIGDLVRPARSRRLLLLVVLVLVVVAIAIVAAHALLGTDAPTHALSVLHREECGGGGIPC
jgi:hypothetical protein